MDNKINIPLKQYYKLLKSYMRPQLVKVIGLLILLCISIGLQLYNPQILRDFIDSAVEGNVALKQLLMLALMFTSIAIMNQIITIAATYLGEYIGWKATNEMRNKLAEHCLRLDMSFHKEHTSGEMIERIDGDVNELSNFFSQFVVKFLTNLVLLAGVLVLLFRVEWRIGLGMTLFVILAIYVMSKIRQFAAPYWKKVSVVRANFYGFLGEHLAGTEDTRSNGASGYVMYKFYELLQTLFPIQLRAGLAGFAIWMSSLFTFALAYALALLLGGYLWSVGTITIGTVYMVFFYTDLISRPIEQIRTQLEDLQKADASIMRITELFGIVSKLQDGSRSDIPPQALSVEFNDVTFRYDTDESILDGINFQLGERKVLGLLGRTGSGKTTLARLLLRFYDVSEGEILLGNVPVRDIHLHTLRQRVGIVTQDIQIFHASVRDNLTFYDTAIPDERIKEVLSDIGLGNWYNSLPAGLDTEMTAGGGGLSAGESQLLAFARVFMKDPGLVILDEASSRLDPATESLIEQAVSKLLKGRTAIIIAHRLSTIQRADEILILEQGRIVEHGDRIALERDGQSRYAQLQAFGLEEHTA